jgi:hypothetical protein
MMQENSHCIHSSHNNFFVSQKGFQWLDQLADIEKLIKATRASHVTLQSLLLISQYTMHITVGSLSSVQAMTGNNTLYTPM